MPSREAGNALADVLYDGHRAKPISVPFPFTTVRDEQVSNAHVVHKANNTIQTPIRYYEGLHVDYRWFDLPDSPEPRFSFGHGLSYTSFDYSHATGRFLKPVFDTSKTEESYPSQLFDDDFEFSFDVTNNGTTNGFEVPQAISLSLSMRVNHQKCFASLTASLSTQMRREPSRGVSTRTISRSGILLSRRMYKSFVHNTLTCTNSNVHTAPFVSKTYARHRDGTTAEVRRPCCVQKVIR